MFKRSFGIRHIRHCLVPNQVSKNQNNACFSASHSKATQNSGLFRQKQGNTPMTRVYRSFVCARVVELASISHYSFEILFFTLITATTITKNKIKVLSHTSSCAQVTRLHLPRLYIQISCLLPS